MSLESSRRLLGWCFALVIFISAFLVFQVQPVISKTILPWFGGSPAVWTTCMMFFQVMLLAGYLYAHGLITYLNPRMQGLVHFALLVGALMVLPITPDDTWKPIDSANPTWRIVSLLGVNLGLPYLLLSATGPLIQSWFSRAFSGASPYRLYALSNVGSLLALLGYPVLVEPSFTTTAQGGLWSVGFCVFALFCGYCAVRLWKSRAGGPESATCQAEETSSATAPTWTTRLVWLSLAAFGSTMLLATTNQVCQDVAVNPFLWVAPLSLYLITFIICFDKEAWYGRRWCAAGTMLSVTALSAVMIAEQKDNIVLLIGVYFASLFFVCMLCHGELVRRKPHPRFLTSFYVSTAAGGAIGGLFVTLVCPLLAATYFEMNLCLLGGFLLAAGLLVAEKSREWFNRTPLARFAGYGLLIVVFWAQVAAVRTEAIASARNFYGVLHVREAESEASDEHGLLLSHGTIMHGFQYLDDERRNTPTTYYAENTGVGVLMKTLGDGHARRVGVVGLGVGTLAAYGREGDMMRFYEINPAVIRLAQKHFTFLSDTPAEVQMALGDARLSLEREAPQRFDILVLDAFSSDSVPVHLLTREAMTVYLRHLKTDGVLAIHISNNHVDLRPVTTALAEANSLRWIETLAPQGPQRAVTGAQWILMSRDSTKLATKALRTVTVLPEGHEKILWTDDYSNLFDVLK
jgi:spermidine synthase